jgi:ornithine cyclodeaminase/alanine dehydrogenase-like protein (mu-crystallin family)
MTLVIDDKDVAQLLSMADCIDALEEAFREMGLGNVVNAPRRDSFMLSSHPEGYYSFKTIEGGLEKYGVVAQRINSDLITHPIINGVPRRVKIPAAPGQRYVGLVFLYSAETLELLAIMSDGHLQRMRVAGTTGLGVKHLSRKDSQQVALMGSGWQAETAAWAITEVRDIEKIQVYSPNKEHREKFCKKLSKKLNAEIISCDEPKKTLIDADIIATATNSQSPVVRGEWIEEGMHLTSIRRVEFDERAWEKSDIIYFSSPPAPHGYTYYVSENWKRSGFKSDMGDWALLEEESFKKYRDKIYLLSDLLTGKSPRRSSDEQITMLNKNWGLGIEFACVARVVYERACEAGIGKEIPSEWFTQTSHP